MRIILSNVRSTIRVSLVLSLTFGALGPAPLRAAETGQTFATPEDAVAALAGAVTTTNVAELKTIFGPESDYLLNPDQVQAANEFAAFAAALAEARQIVRESDTRCVLDVGTNDWPFPVPIVAQGGRWFFDSPAGRDEILNRRIGENEIHTLDVMRAAVAAQREYASHDRTGDQVLEYAQKIVSTPGKKDGLYWSPDIDGEISPLGPLAADAATEGYGKQARVEGQRRPFHGYFFKILTRQGKSAPGGKYSYIINGHMIGGFAFVAWPAQYGETGIMTFIVNQQGRVYQKDLGPKTGALAERMKVYDPDKTWTVSPD